MSFAENVFSEINKEVEKSKRKYENIYQKKNYPNKTKIYTSEGTGDSKKSHDSKSFFHHVKRESTKENELSELGVPKEMIDSQSSSIFDNTVHRMKRNVYFSTFDTDLKGGSVKQKGVNDGFVTTGKFTNSENRKISKAKVWERKTKKSDMKSLDMKRKRKIKVPKKKAPKRNRDDSNEKEKLRYENVLELHEMWKEYIKDLVDDGRGNIKSEELLLKCDYHGSIMKVIKSKCTSYIGVKGIVLRESENTFKIITKNDKIKTILKRNTTFEVEVLNNIVTIFGDQFIFKSYERSARKFKTQ